MRISVHTDRLATRRRHSLIRSWERYEKYVFFASGFGRRTSDPLAHASIASARSGDAMPNAFGYKVSSGADSWMGTAR